MNDYNDNRVQRVDNNSRKKDVYRQDMTKTRTLTKRRDVRSTNPYNNCNIVSLLSQSDEQYDLQLILIPISYA
jgi:hypothetical protein